MKREGEGGRWKEWILGYNNNSEIAFSRFLSENEANL